MKYYTTEKSFYVIVAGGRDFSDVTILDNNSNGICICFLR